jgi:hypothetical protein
MALRSFRLGLLVNQRILVVLKALIAKHYESSTGITNQRILVVLKALIAKHYESSTGITNQSG